jgi:hypothetical protein
MGSQGFPPSDTNGLRRLHGPEGDDPTAPASPAMPAVSSQPEPSPSEEAASLTPARRPSPFARLFGRR